MFLSLGEALFVDTDAGESIALEEVLAVEDRTTDEAGLCGVFVDALASAVEGIWGRRLPTFDVLVDV